MLEVEYRDLAPSRWQTRTSASARSSPQLARVLALQRQAGNRATAGYLRRQDTADAEQGRVPHVQTTPQVEPAVVVQRCGGGGCAGACGRNEDPSAGWLDTDEEPNSGPASAAVQRCPAAAGVALQRDLDTDENAGAATGSSQPELVVTFAKSSAELDAPARSALDAYAARRAAILTPSAPVGAVMDSAPAAGAGSQVRVEGYASPEGPPQLNFRLSADRAAAVAAELTKPTDGSPGLAAADIQQVPHGGSTAAGPDMASNRRATVGGGPGPSPGPGPNPDPGPNPEPGPNPPGCTLPRLLGTGRRHDPGAADMAHNDRPRVSGGSQARLEAWALVTGGTTDRDKVSSSTSGWLMSLELDQMGGALGVQAYDEFVQGAGATHTHSSSSPLGALAVTSPSFRASAEQVKSFIEPQLTMQAAAGAPDACALTVPEVPETHFAYLGSDPGALKAVIGGTQGEELYLTEFAADVAARSYTMTLRFVIVDHFGVDETDLYTPGLIGFWVLQHERGNLAYKPYLNTLDLSIKVVGKF